MTGGGDPVDHFETRCTRTLITRFRVDDAQPRELEGAAGGWLSVVVFTKTFTSGILGTATTVFMSAPS